MSDAALVEGPESDETESGHQFASPAKDITAGTRLSGTAETTLAGPRPRGSVRLRWKGGCSG